jgi:hypothetical protein
MTKELKTTIGVIAIGLSFLRFMDLLSAFEQCFNNTDIFGSVFIL